MKLYLILLFLLVCTTAVSAQSGPGPVGVDGFAPSPETHRTGGLRIEPYLLLLWQVVENGPYSDSGTGVESIGSEVGMIEAGGGIRLGVSSSVEFQFRGAVIGRSSTGGYVYSKGQWRLRLTDAYQNEDLIDAELGTNIRLDHGEGSWPETTLATGLRFRSVGSSPYRPALIGSSVRLLMRSPLDSGSELRYSVGVAMGTAWSTLSSHGAGFSSNDDIKVKPGYSLAYVFSATRALSLGIETTGEYAMPTGFRPWLGLGAWVSPADWGTLTVAGRASSTFGELEWQMMLGASIGTF